MDLQHVIKVQETVTLSEVVSPYGGSRGLSSAEGAGEMDSQTGRLSGVEKTGSVFHALTDWPQ